MTKHRSDDPAVKTTLILAPLALLGQWKTEIEEKTDYRMSVHIYHGQGKAVRKADLQKHDVVLTTYTVSWKDPSHFSVFLTILEHGS